MAAIERRARRWDPIAPTARPDGSPNADVLALVVGALALCVYARTAARTITFWEGAEYSLLARTLSIANPPGSLALTLIGRAFSDVPIAASIAARLNLIAALIGALTAAVLAKVAVEVARARPRASGASALAGGAAGALIWAFARTPWRHATQFTPYGLSALVSAVILALFLRWWRRAEADDALGTAALLAFALGIDVSVHRTNVVLVPALVLGTLLRRPQALTRPRALAALAGAFVLGLALQLVYIPLSRREPFLDVAAPDSLAALWRYVRLDMIGGHFLVDAWPRRAPFVRVQLGDLARFLRENLGAHRGWVPAAALVVVGGVSIARRSVRLALALLGFVLASGFGVVLFLDRPPSYFRSLDRHYLVVLVTLVPLLAAGAAALVDAVRTHAGRGVAVLAMLGVGGLPLAQAITNARACDLSRTRFADTYARDLLEPLRPHALLLTNGDNDSFPPWYLQCVERVRPDVTVVNVSVARTPSGARRIRRADPALASFAPSDTLIADLARRCLGRRPVYLAVTLVTPGPIPGITDRMDVEGLAWRIRPMGERPDAEPLQRFVRDRLPRAHFDDPGQRLDEGVASLAANYAAAALQLAAAEVARGDGRSALDTLATLERYVPRWRLPTTIADGMDEAIARTRGEALRAVRDHPSRVSAAARARTS